MATFEMLQCVDHCSLERRILWSSVTDLMRMQMAHPAGKPSMADSFTCWMRMTLHSCGNCASSSSSSGKELLNVSIQMVPLQSVGACLRRTQIYPCSPTSRYVLPCLLWQGPQCLFLLQPGLLAIQTFLISMSNCMLEM